MESSERRPDDGNLLATVTAVIQRDKDTKNKKITHIHTKKNIFIHRIVCAVTKKRRIENKNASWLTKSIKGVWLRWHTVKSVAAFFGFGVCVLMYRVFRNALSHCRAINWISVRYCLNCGNFWSIGFCARLIQKCLDNRLEITFLIWGVYFGCGVRRNSW